MLVIYLLVWVYQHPGRALHGGRPAETDTPVALHLLVSARFHRHNWGLLVVEGGLLDGDVQRFQHVAVELALRVGQVVEELPAAHLLARVLQLDRLVN